MNALSAPSLQPIHTLASQPTRGVVMPAALENTPRQDKAQTEDSNRSASNTATHQPPNLTQDNTKDSAKDTAQQQRQIENVLTQLQARDREVKAHEQAHLNTAGQYATGGIKYTYQTGPNGQKYAIGGSVGIDTAPIAGDPQATIQKARVVQRAALAPAQPSSQDMSVAAQAAQMLMQAQIDLRTQKTETEQTDHQPTDNQHAEASKQIQPNVSDNRMGIADASYAAHAIHPSNSARSGFDLRLALQPAPLNGIASSSP